VLPLPGRRGKRCRAYLLFPNKWNASNKVEKGKSYRIPPEEGEIDFIARMPEGTEYVKAVATLEPMKSMTANVFEGGSPFAPLIGPVKAWQRIETELKSKPQSDWAKHKCPWRY